MRRVLPLVLIAACKSTCQNASPVADASPTPDAANQTSAPDATLADEPMTEAAAHEAGSLTIHRVSGCTIALDEQRAPTGEEIMALLNMASSHSPPSAPTMTSVGTSGHVGIAPNVAEKKRPQYAALSLDSVAATILPAPSKYWTSVMYHTLLRT